MDWMQVAGLIIGSSAFSTVATAYVSRRKNNSDISSQSVKTALELEERVHSRYQSAQQALDTAQLALNAARVEIRSYEDYVNMLHDLLDEAGIAYPARISMLGLTS